MTSWGLKCGLKWLNKDVSIAKQSVDNNVRWMKRKERTLPSGVTGPEYGACSPINTGQMSKNSWRGDGLKQTREPKTRDNTGKRLGKDGVPSPSSCPASRQSSGHSWGRRAPCTGPCGTVARCPSAPQTPCWPTTAGAGGTRQTCSGQCEQSGRRLILHVSARPRSRWVTCPLRVSQLWR